MLSISLGENLLPKSSWLLIVGVWMGVLMSADLSGDILLSPGKLFILNWSSSSVWLVVWTSTMVLMGGRSVSKIVVDSSSVWAVNWNLLIVLSKSVSVGIWIREKSSLEHLIVGWLNTWNEMRWGESGLLNLSMIVLWVSVQGQLTNFLEWVVTVWPDLGDIKDIKSVVVSILFWHNLNIPGPRWEVLSSN